MGMHLRPQQRYMWCGEWRDVRAPVFLGRASGVAHLCIRATISRGPSLSRHSVSLGTHQSVPCRLASTWEGAGDDAVANPPPLIRLGC